MMMMIIIIIIILVIIYVQGIYSYVPETNHVSRVYSVAAATRKVISPGKCVLYFYINTFPSICQVPNMPVFCSSLVSCFPGMLLRNCLSDFEMVPVASVITGITFAPTFRMRLISIVWSFYFKIFTVCFLITLLSAGIASSITMHVPFSFSRIMMSDLLL